MHIQSFIDGANCILATVKTPLVTLAVYLGEMSSSRGDGRRCSTRLNEPEAMPMNEKKESALQLVAELGFSQRKAAEAAGLSRSALRKCVAISFLLPMHLCM